MTVAVTPVAAVGMQHPLLDCLEVCTIGALASWDSFASCTAGGLVGGNIPIAAGSGGGGVTAVVSAATCAKDFKTSRELR
jgi:hypothetical protein